MFTGNAMTSPWEQISPKKLTFLSTQHSKHLQAQLVREEMVEPAPLKFVLFDSGRLMDVKTPSRNKRERCENKV